jgi:hypothetical protein
MTDGPLWRLFRRMVDDLDYLWTLATLCILDRLAGPLPETPADPEANIVADGLQQRARDRERLERAFPRLER